MDVLFLLQQFFSPVIELWFLWFVLFGISIITKLLRRYLLLGSIAKRILFVGITIILFLRGLLLVVFPYELDEFAQSTASIPVFVSLRDGKFQLTTSNEEIFRYKTKESIQKSILRRGEYQKDEKRGRELLSDSFIIEQKHGHSLLSRTSAFWELSIPKSYRGDQVYVLNENEGTFDLRESRSVNVEIYASYSSIKVTLPVITGDKTYKLNTYGSKRTSLIFATSGPSFFINDEQGAIHNVPQEMKEIGRNKYAITGEREGTVTISINSFGQRNLAVFIVNEHNE
ncbi:hypothetical protein IT418_00995 [bacterium]|nr:hypothetical protein [bacterium]